MKKNECCILFSYNIHTVSSLVSLTFFFKCFFLFLKKNTNKTKKVVIFLLTKWSLHFFFFNKKVWLILDSSSPFKLKEMASGTLFHTWFKSFFPPSWMKWLCRQNAFRCIIFAFILGHPAPPSSPAPTVDLQIHGLFACRSQACNNFTFHGLNTAPIKCILQCKSAT